MSDFNIIKKGRFDFKVKVINHFCKKNNCEKQRIDGTGFCYEHRKEYYAEYREKNRVRINNNARMWKKQRKARQNKEK